MWIYGDNYLYYADCRGEDDNFNITLVWNQPYKVIHQANSLIKKLDAGDAVNAKPEEVARIKSEALAMRGLALFDLTRLNAIVTRANPVKSVTSADLTLERILKERRKELVGEGHAFFDYVRNGKSVDRSGGWHLTMPEDTRVISPSDPRVALPIPQAENDANPNIVQNPR